LVGWLTVTNREKQHQVLMEAYSNHGPRVIIIDELGNLPEVKVARSVAQRGVSLVATGHGRNLQSIINNPELMSLGINRHL
jgi:stage III sporulation protein SpoIIIAA